jgi:hypothetical protein
VGKRTRKIGLALRCVAVALLFIGFGVRGLTSRTQSQTQQPGKKESPFYCNINTLSAAERAHKKQIGDKMAASRVDTNELANGYAFRFRPDGVTLVELADWVESERRCCPFFDMSIETEREGGSLWLKLTGREGVEQFIRGEFKGLKRE